MASTAALSAMMFAGMCAMVLGYRIVGCVLLAACVFSWFKGRKDRSLDLGSSDADEDTERFMRPPESEQLTFHGVRVVELSTVIAAPCCAYMMAELGAEVIKVEDPRGGDMWRKFMLEFESSRPFSSVFEAVNRGKKSVVLDVKTADGLAKLLEILGAADVFITNVRNDALQRLGLDYESLHLSLPRLIYAQVSAYGLTGPDSALAGYDIGAFWAATGMTSSTQCPGRYSIYPMGMGDGTLSSNLLSGIALALRHRLLCGTGQRVDSALLRVGMWCMAAELMRAKRSPRTTPTDSPMRAAYRCADESFVMVAEPRDANDESLGRLALALGVKLAELKQYSAHGLKAKIGELVCTSTQYRTAAQWEERLLEYGLQASRVKAMTEFPAAIELDPSITPHFESVPPVPDIPKFCKLPFEQPSARPRKQTGRAPRLGQHTASVLQHGWLRRLDAFDTATLPQERDARVLALSGVTVIELSERGVCVPAVCCQLRDYGAQVIKIERAGGCSWRDMDEELFNHLNRAKQSVRIDADTQAGRHAIVALVRTADAFVTNLPLSRLRALGLDYEAVRAMKAEGIVYGMASPFGIDGPQQPSSDSAVFWCGSGLASLLSGLNSAPRTQPLELGELISSFHLTAAVCAGLFQQQRLRSVRELQTMDVYGGGGVFVETSLRRTAMFIMHQTLSLLLFDAAKAQLFAIDSVQQTRQFPVPTSNSYETADGHWLQLLGIDLKKSLPKTLTALGIRSRCYPRLALALTKVIMRKGPLWAKAVPLLEVLNADIRSAVGTMTLGECRAAFERENVWFTQMVSPEQALLSEQAAATATFGEVPQRLPGQASGGLLVNVPCRLSCSPQHGVQGPPPQLGEHDYLLAKAAHG